MTRAEYFAGVEVEFVKDINEKNPNLNDVEEYLPKKSNDWNKKDLMVTTLTGLILKQRPVAKLSSCNQCNTQYKNPGELRKHIQQMHDAHKLISLYGHDNPKFEYIEQKAIGKLVSL